MIDKDSAAPGGVRAIDVAPAIADEKAALQIDAALGRCPQEHSGLRFPALARIAMARAGVITDLDRIERRNRGAKLRMHRFHGGPALSSATNIRLIADDDEGKPSGFQLSTSLGCSGIQFELLNGRRRKRKAVAHHRVVENSVAIEKNRGLFYFVLSHFVCAVFSAGCETSKCQITA